MYEFIDRPSIRRLEAHAAARQILVLRGLLSYRRRPTWRTMFVTLQLAYWTGLLVLILSRWKP